MDNVDLRDAFVAMGAKDIFDSNKADMSGITKGFKIPGIRLALDHFVHKVKFDVLEKIGTAPTYQNGIQMASKL